MTKLEKNISLAIPFSSFSCSYGKLDSLALTWVYTCAALHLVANQNAASTDSRPFPHTGAESRFRICRWRVC
jgi:hypothetical protein